MKRSLILLIIICFFSCKSAHRYNPEAIKLNDSAAAMQMEKFQVSLIKYGSVDSIKKVQIGLLNKATSIDTDYFTGYWNRLALQNSLKLYKEAAITCKQLIRLRPNDAFISFFVAEVYDETGDTISARKCYVNSLAMSNMQLYGEDTNNKRFKSAEFNKAKALVMLGEQKKANNLLLELYNNETEPFLKSLYKDYMNKSKADIIDENLGTSTIKTF